MIVIEFVGTICAGKWSLIEALRNRMKNRMKSDLSGYLVKVIAPDLIIQTELAQQKYFERQLLLGNHITDQLIRLKDLAVPHLIVLVHRGLYDAQVFMFAFILAGLVNRERAEAQITAWQANAGELTDLVVLVKTPLKVALQRAQTKFPMQFHLKSDAVFSRGFFDILEQCYADFERRLPPHSVVVDGTRESSKSAAKILDRILVRTREGGTRWGGWGPAGREQAESSG